MFEKWQIRGFKDCSPEGQLYVILEVKYDRLTAWFWQTIYYFKGKETIPISSSRPPTVISQVSLGDTLPDSEILPPESSFFSLSRVAKRTPSVCQKVCTGCRWENVIFQEVAKTCHKRKTESDVQWAKRDRKPWKPWDLPYSQKP